MWAASGGGAGGSSSVRTVEVEFKELEFIDPSRMVRKISGFETRWGAGGRLSE